MTDHKTPQEKLHALGANISSTVNEALNEARPAVGRMADRMADRVSDQLNELTQQGKEAALDAEHALHKRALHARHSAEQVIQHAPIRSVLIAAGTGAVTALAVSWLMHLRKN
jgi:ElaB/YqjD/DUF883 family membrane-anchored ribosome-binding protein